jgi:ribonuclease P protein component
LQTFKKEERLREKKIIEQLFDKGSSFYLNPFKVIFDEADFGGNFPAKVMVTLSARNFKRAVDRNRIKRLMREAYRKNKHILYDATAINSKKIAVIIIYTGKVMISSREAESKIILILQRLVKENEESAE